MKTIGFVMPSLGIGGCERAVSNMSIALSEKYNIKLIFFEGNNVVFKYSGKIVDLNQPSRKDLVGKIINSFVRWNKLRKIIRSEHIDILYMFLNAENILNFYRPRNCVKIVSCRGFGDLLHGERFSLYGLMTKRSDGIVFNSHRMLEYFIDKYPKLKSKSYVMHNLYDFDLIKSHMDEKIDLEHQAFINSHKTIIAVGRVCKEKAFSSLIKAFELLKVNVQDAGLIIVGDGVLFENVKKLSLAGKYSKDILFTGYQNNPYKYLTKCDVFALSSINEGFPNVVIEAMFCGLPVVCTNCDSGPNEILNKENIIQVHLTDIHKAEYGLLTPVMRENDADDISDVNDTHRIFANALEIMLSDTDLRDKYSNKSIIRAKCFDASSNIDNYTTIFNQMEGRR